MALASGLALGAAAASGIALGTSCMLKLETFRRELEDAARQQAAALAPKAVAHHEAAPPHAPHAHSGHRSGGHPTHHMKEEHDESIGDMDWRGFTMEDARLLADEAQAATIAKTPSEVLMDLQKGNTRFWMNRATRPERSAFERRALVTKQFPTVAVLGCSDSRVPTELVFDQGLGDVFVIRVAGNCLAVSTAASLQYAVHHLKVKVLVVLGHELCGAVKAAQLPDSQLDREPTELATALKSIKVGLDAEKLKLVQDSRALDREAVTANVRNQVKALQMDSGMMQHVNSGNLIITGGFYEISSGIVDFFSEVSGPSS